MTPEDAFLADIIEHPDDDTPRLVYADWLEEHGQPDRAEFIRVACRLAKLEEDDPQRQELGARHRDFVEKYVREWAGPLANLAQRWWFDRGFVKGMEIHAATLLRQAETVFGSAPVRDLRLQNAEGMTGGLAACSHLERVTALYLQGSSIGDAGLRELLSSPYRKRPSTYLGRLRKLSLANTGIRPAGLDDLLARSHLIPDLADIDLAGNELGDDVVETLAASPLSGRLRGLNLSWCLGAAGVRALVTSATFGELRSLHLVSCQVGDAECEVLAASSALPMLTDLSLGGSRYLRPGRITTAGIEVLVHSPKLSRLRYLHLGGSAIGDTGAEVLASSAQLQELRSLSLEASGIGAQGVRALTRSRFWPTLQALFLSRNPLGDEGANAFLAAPVPARLFCLFLPHCDITEPLQQALQERFGNRVHV
jgi:uncharacterized protein (TIGR02996 family)